MEICPSQVSKPDLDEPALWLAVLKNEIDFALRGDAEAIFWLFSANAVFHFEFTMETVCDYAGVEAVEIRRRAKVRMEERGVNLFMRLTKIESDVQKELSEPPPEGEQLNLVLE